MSLVCHLEDTSLDTLAKCGGKAARLGEAMRAGCPVPDGVVLSTDLYRRFMRQGGLQGEITSILTTMHPTEIPHFQAVEWAIQSAFKVRRMPKEVIAAIGRAWELMGGLPVGVRSSATNEDSPLHSFVGQHATYLDVDTEDALVQAVLGCWMSLYSAEALYYAYRFGVDLLNSAMAVLVQRMIQPSAQGALFTVDPITGNPDVFLLEVQQGPERGVHRLDPYERLSDEPEAWSDLRRMGLLLDELLLRYQTVEWAIADAQVQLLRVRPVTSVPPYLPVAIREADEGRGPLELIREPGCQPRAARPYSWYHRSRSRAMNAAYFRNPNRLYASYSGRDEFFLRGYLYVRWRRLALAADKKASPLRRALITPQRLLAARTLDRQFRVLWQEKRPRLDQLNQMDISTLTDRELASHLREVMALNGAFMEQCGHLGDSPTVVPDILLRLHARWLGDDGDCQALLAMAEDQTSRRDQALQRLAQTEHADEQEREQAFGAFFRRYRHLYLRGDPLAEGQDICVLQEEESAAREALRAEMDRADQAHQPQGEPGRATGQEIEDGVFARLDRVRGAIYGYALVLARRYAPLRVDASEPVLLCLLLERDAVREVGRRLQAAGPANSPQDACLLGCREILDWLDGDSPDDQAARLISERRALARRWWRYAPPDLLGGQATTTTADVIFRVAGKSTLRGRAVSPGLVEGCAHVVNTLAQATNVLPGEVLVCREPLFELSPLFSTVSAVLAEKGGLLSHAATLAREYGVPAIFGLERATALIHTGDEVQVDANRGIVALRHAQPGWNERA